MFLSLNSLVWILPTLIVVGGTFLFARWRRKETLAQLQGLKTNASPVRRRILTAAILTAFALAGMALLRPYGGTILSEHRKPAKNIVLLIDVSKSMKAADAEGLNRLEAAKLFARELIDSRPTDRIGLISFAGATFPECPTTLDRTMLLQRLDVIDPDTMLVGGTDFTVALNEANHLLTTEPPPGSAIVILSDGDNVANDPTEAAQALAKKKVPVFTLAVGTNGMDVPIPGSQLRTRTDYGILQKISRITGGHFNPATPTNLDATIGELNSRIDAIELFGNNIAPEIYNRPLELYAYPLTVALILLMLHMFLPLRTKKWHPLTAVITLSCFLALPAPAQSTTADQQALNEKLSGYTAAKELAIEEELPLVFHFVGSDWSKLSITFEREILSHPVYQKWEKAKAITRTIDLPRTNISPERRQAHRALAKKFAVDSYPTSVFIDVGTEAILGRLTHDPAGPASWVNRAKAIISGDESASDSAASIDYLPEHVQKNLTDKSLTPDQRSLRFYNKAVELERANPGLTYTSDDRLKLILDLYDKAAAEATSERTDLRFKALHKQAIILHTKARKMVPDWDESEMSPEQIEAIQKAAGRGGLIKLLNNTIKSYNKALNNYRQAAPLHPGHPELTINLATAYRDRNRAKQYLRFIKAYNKAVETTATALVNETRFRRSLDREVTTSQTVNRKTIEESIDAIDELITAAEAIQEKPTLLEPEQLPDFLLAREDIILAPSPHGIRDLHPSTQHIKNALEHLIDPQKLQQQPMDMGEGEEGGDPQGDKDKGSPDDITKQEKGAGKKDREADLRRAGKEQGDLRDRLLQQLGKNHRRVPRSQDK